MTPREAIEKAKAYIREVFTDESPEDIGLEELVHDPSEGKWDVTIGFTRAWDRPRGVFATAIGNDVRPYQRTFKTVEIRDEDGEVVGVRHWQAAA